MTEPVPSVYLFYGDDEFTIMESVSELRERLGDPSSAEMNFERFDSVELDFEQFFSACHALPFLSARRMIVLERCERLPGGETFWRKMIDCLETLPDTTALILIENTDHYQSKRKDYFQESRLWNWSQAQAAGVYTRNFIKPKGSLFLKWLRDRFQAAGVEIDPDAVRLLSEFSGEEPRLAVQEIEKLLSYVNYSRQIDVADVLRVSISQSEADIFALVDAIGDKDLAAAIGLLRRILEEQEIVRVFSMIVRQFRLLLLAREAIDSGSDPKETLPSRTPDFVRQKLERQAGNFSLQDLKMAYLALMRLELENKSGKVDLSTGLDLFILSLMGAPGEIRLP